MSEFKTKEFEVQEQLRKERKNIRTFDELIQFLENVKDNYNCGYGEAPRAIAQAALATAWHLADEFGITGFQAGFVMWDFIRDWQYRNNKCGLKIINYDDMLYPQYDYKFEKELSQETFDTLQSAAKELLTNKDEYVHPKVLKHWKSIANGNIPFGYSIKCE